MIYRDYPVTFDASKSPTVTERGEHNTIRLVVDLPTDFDGITSGTVVFKVKSRNADAQEIPYPWPSEDGQISLEGNKLYILLWEDLTAGETLQFCLEAWTQQGSRPQRVYSPDSERLRFADHIGLGAISAPPGLIAEFLRKLPIIRNIGEKNGRLTYNGKPIAGYNPKNKKVLEALSEEGGALAYNGQPVASVTHLATDTDIDELFQN
jgi:hypothetical protein